MGRKVWQVRKGFFSQQTFSIKKMGGIMSWLLGYRAIQNQQDEQFEKLWQHLEKQEKERRTIQQNQNEIREQVMKIQQELKKMLENQQTILSRNNSAQKPQPTETDPLSRATSEMPEV